MKSTGWTCRGQHAEEAVGHDSGRGDSVPVAPRLIGLFVGATGGLVFVVANTHAPLDPAASMTLRILAAVGLIALAALTVLTVRPSGPARSLSERRPAGDEVPYRRGFWLIVAGELALLQVGFQLLHVLDAPGQSRVAWIALVVGLHFVALARLWRERSIALIGGILSALGAVGLAISGTSAVDWAPFVSGVLSGFVLLTGSLAAVITGVIPNEPSSHAPKPEDGLTARCSYGGD